MSIDHDRLTLRPSAASGLAEAAGVAGLAPSIHNTQPWRWRVDGDTLELYTEPTRQLPETDPGARLMVLSCGVALHHARTALAAQGLRVAIDRLPSPSQPRLVARICVSGHTAASPAALRFLQTIQLRHTDRRPVSDTAVEQSQIDAIRLAVEAERTWLNTLRTDDVLVLAAAADRAQTFEEFEPRWREEMDHWAGGARRDGLGVPASAILQQPAETTLPSRDFGVIGDLQVGAGHDRDAVYAILFGPEDTPLAWLNAGEALSAAWLTAIQLGLSLTPMSAVVEVDSTQQVLRQLLPGLGQPFLVLRFGMADLEQVGLPRTARLPSTQVIDIVASVDARPM